MTDIFLRKKIREMLAEDFGRGDVTSEVLIKPNLRAKAEVISKQEGMLAGAREAAMIFREVGVRAKIRHRDGENIQPGDVVLELEGPARKILGAERVALNLMMRMSGIATVTRELIERARRKNPKIVIAATRKTAPLLKYFDKRAVKVAGGWPHRFDLSDQVLIKDNHLRLVGPITMAVRKFKEQGNYGKIEVETTTPEEALEAARAGADIVMLDNMSPSQIRQAIRLLGREGLRKRVTLEASGGITPANVAEYATTGVDIISTSYMTMRACAIDMSLKVKEIVGVRGQANPVSGARNHNRKRF
ncbi:MAG: carboxylating nicotinate-nucleotide diphosphorylase [Candidatus Hadarchaeum sp.]|uniref:carboxylating nicotinate-nucleotide diphosphorylase n=1 Tax=Candidatus Hadarchaeum sp. TaxID=2883567 RepID=UPI003D099164